MLNRLKYAMIAVALVMAPAFAQPPGGGPGNFLDRLKVDLQLTDQQVQQLQPLFQEQESRRQAMRTQIESVLTEQQRQALRQNRPQPGQRPFDNLGLTADQKARIDQIMASQQNDRGTFDARLNAVLTPEQQAKFQQLRQRHGGPRGGRG